MPLLRLVLCPVVLGCASLLPWGQSPITTSDARAIPATDASTSGQHARINHHRPQTSTQKPKRDNRKKGTTTRRYTYLIGYKYRDDWTWSSGPDPAFNDPGVPFVREGACLNTVASSGSGHGERVFSVAPRTMRIIADEKHVFARFADGEPNAATGTLELPGRITYTGAHGPGYPDECNPLSAPPPVSWKSWDGCNGIYDTTGRLRPYIKEKRGSHYLGVHETEYEWPLDIPEHPNSPVAAALWEDATESCAYFWAGTDLDGAVPRISRFIPTGAVRAVPLRRWHKRAIPRHVHVTWSHPIEDPTVPELSLRTTITFDMVVLPQKLPRKQCVEAVTQSGALLMVLGITPGPATIRKAIRACEEGEGWGGILDD